MTNLMVLSFIYSMNHKLSIIRHKRWALDNQLFYQSIIVVFIRKLYNHTNRKLYSHTKIDTRENRTRDLKRSTLQSLKSTTKKIQVDWEPMAFVTYWIIFLHSCAWYDSQLAVIYFILTYSKKVVIPCN